MIASTQSMTAVKPRLSFCSAGEVESWLVVERCKCASIGYFVDMLVFVRDAESDKDLYYDQYKNRAVSSVPRNEHATLASPDVLNTQYRNKDSWFPFVNLAIHLQTVRPEHLWSRLNHLTTS